ncbi:MAG: UTRA domain-containing protein, partial [Robiginitomaculum sp.]|nr:UTRA domain-containing protein [Robiginitomaculum sp.]
TMVTFTAPVSSSFGNMDGLLEDMLNIVQETKVQILEFDYLVAAPHVTDALKLSPGAKVQHAVRTRHKDDTPFSYVITYVPEDIGRSFKRTDLKSQPILAMIEKAGVNIARACQTVTATLADGTTGPALDIGIGSPLLKVTRIVYDDNDRPVEYIIIYYWPGLYRINMELSRMHNAEDGGNFWAMNMK